MTTRRKEQKGNAIRDMKPGNRLLFLNTTPASIQGGGKEDLPSGAVVQLLSVTPSEASIVLDKATYQVDPKTQVKLVRQLRDIRTGKVKLLTDADAAVINATLKKGSIVEVINQLNGFNQTEVVFNGRQFQVRNTGIQIVLEE